MVGGGGGERIRHWNTVDKCKNSDATKETSTTTLTSKQLCKAAVCVEGGGVNNVGGK